MRTLLDLGLSTSERERVLAGIHQGNYNLLLGAGSSYGCVGGDGTQLLDGASVSQAICKDFELKLNEDESKRLTLSYLSTHALAMQRVHCSSCCSNPFIQSGATNRRYPSLGGLGSHHQIDLPWASRMSLVPNVFNEVVDQVVLAGSQARHSISASRVSRKASFHEVLSRFHVLDDLIRQFSHLG